jgi:4-hydroxy-2-oxoheptanedioate aldolase
LSKKRIRKQWEAGQIAIDCWLSGSSMTSAEAIGRLGFESVVIDTQHTMADFRDVAGCLLALTGTGTTAIVRVVGNDPLMIQKILDAGADGVMCPMISNRAQAEAFVGACRYAPLGYRSVGAYRPAEGMLEYFRTANEEIVTLAQIETAEAMDNLDEIAATPGLDVLFMGPGDLSVSYGGEPVIDYTDPVTAERHRRVVEAAHAAGKKAGMLALGPGDIALAVEFGMDMVSVAMEGLLVVAGAQAKLAEGREAAAARAAVPA